MVRREFENELLSGNVAEKFLSMSREELEEKFGSEFVKTVDFGDQNNNNHQYNLFEHIMRTVDNVKTNGLSQEDMLKVKIAAFFHDIGKPNVAQLNEKTGQTQFIGHAKQSAEIAKQILENLGYNEQEIAELNFLIQSHDDFIPIAKMTDITEERISKVLASTMKKSENYQSTISDFKKLITLCKADAMAQNKMIEKNGKIVDTQEDRIARLEAIEEILPKAIIFQQEQEIAKLENKKSDLQNGPTPIKKNGKIVNQKQIDMWNAMSKEEKEERTKEIDAKISALKDEEQKLLELKNKEHELQNAENDEKNLAVKFEFVVNGTTAEQTPEENTIWIDVGNKMETGIIDHHGEAKDNSVCATEMVYKHPELVLQNITNPNELTIVGHILPDFDCVASAYLVKKLAENGGLTPEMEKVVGYAKLTDTGRINPGRNDIKNPYSILNAFAYMPENQNVSFDELNNNIIKNGFSLIDYCLERVRQNPELTFDSPGLIEDDSPFIEELNLLEQASKEYEKVIKTADKTELILPTVDGKAKNVPSVFVNDIPENELTRDMMKSWLRDDGCVFTSIPVYNSHSFRTDNGQVLDNVKTSRVILSVAPGNGVNLDGLGKNLEDKESEKCAALGIIRYSKERDGNISYENRPGYESPDPWYDGRGHNYEIIDGPMSGSVLSVEEINEIAKKYSKHIEKAYTLERSVTESNELDEKIFKNSRDSKL